jgi:hypothetical protein
MVRTTKTLIAILLGMFLGLIMAIIIMDMTYNVFSLQAPGSIILLLPLAGAGLGVWVVNRKGEK